MKEIKDDFADEIMLMLRFFLLEGSKGIHKEGKHDTNHYKREQLC